MYNSENINFPKETGEKDILCDLTMKEKERTVTDAITMGNDKVEEMFQNFTTTKGLFNLCISTRCWLLQLTIPVQVLALGSYLGFSTLESGSPSLSTCIRIYLLNSG